MRPDTQQGLSEGPSGLRGVRSGCWFWNQQESEGPEPWQGHFHPRGPHPSRPEPCPLRRWSLAPLPPRTGGLEAGNAGRGWPRPGPEPCCGARGWTPLAAHTKPQPQSPNLSMRVASGDTSIPVPRDSSLRAGPALTPGLFKGGLAAGPASDHGNLLPVSCPAIPAGSEGMGGGQRAWAGRASDSQGMLCMMLWGVRAAEPDSRHTAVSVTKSGRDEAGVSLLPSVPPASWR